MTALQVTRFMHSRMLLIIMAIAMVAVAVLWSRVAPVEAIAGDRGTLFPSANLWIASRDVSMWLNVALTLLSGALIVVLNRLYNLLRTTSLLDASLFFVMCMSTPGLLDCFNSGTLLCLCLLVCLLLLYSTYQQPRMRERIFLIFFILSTMAMTQYCYVVYMPVFIIGCVQMRIFSFKTLVAILCGVISPWLVVLGCGIVPIDGVHAPDIATVFGVFNIAENADIVIAAAVTTVVLVAGWVLNFPRMIAYNAHIRAYNGTMSVLALVTVLVVCIDFTNLLAYVPTLCMCSAFFIGRMFAANAAVRSYIAILSIIVVYLLLLIWKIMP